MTPRIRPPAFAIPTLFAILISPGLMAPTHAQPPIAARQLEFFERRVRPLLVEHCYQCHSADAERIEGSLRLDSRQSHLQGGDSGPSIVPGQAAESLLIEAVRYESYEMPPAGRLPDEDINTLVEWVNMGAPWPEETAPVRERTDTFDLPQRKAEFWLWQPMQQPARPEVSQTDWPRSDIDAFILAGLEQAGLSPAPDTDRRALLRRLTFDLIGLPPTPAEVAAFVADERPDATARVVDRLLQSPHFGERWGRHWLDLVRYAESRGHEFDNDTPNAFQYRDYVIRALNADVPYDQFVREHIAGDLLTSPRRHKSGFNESVLGTGFWFLGEWVHSPVDIRKDESDRFDNMIDVMSKTFLGVTVACARCHDHKFDAISTADYYSLSGFLQSSDYRQVRFESLEHNRRIARQLATLDERYQRQILNALADTGLTPPRQTSYPQDESIVVNYGNLPQGLYLQDGFRFGMRPRPEARAYLSDDGTIEISRAGTATTDPAWRGLENITEGGVQNRDAIARLSRSGRTLRTPTFELRHGDVHCLVHGEGHVIACVDSHRLVAGPLHKQTIVAIKPGQRWVKLNLSRYVGHRLHLEFVPADSGLSVRLVTQGQTAEDLADLDRRLLAVDRPYVAYAEAAEALINQTVPTETEVFADFESGTYDGWTIEGEAFGRIPQTLETIADYQGRINGVGRFFVNSHNIRPGGDVRAGDRLTGTLTSDEFVIDCDTIEFLVGGGAHAGRTCVNLLVGERAVRTATGKANNQMSPHVWDVRALAGKTARIQVVDHHTTGWGNIGIDHIVFRRAVDSAAAEAITAASPERSAGNIAAASRLRSLVEEWQTQRDQLSAQIQRRSRLALSMMDGTGEEDHILIRGNSARPGRQEARHFLTAVSGAAPLKIRAGSGRLELAAQINDPANPLTSRVIVNRIWHHLMGRGIVATVDDFGVLGQRPTHPELLDYLGQQFLRDGRSIKRFIRAIVLSRTYQMSSQPDPQAMAKDPTNRLRHHCPPRRLQGEAIRDALLAVSGRLDPRPFGPPVPIHLTPFMDGRGRPGQSGPLDGRGRRSIYISVRRNFLSPFMLSFDTPVPFSAMGRRNVSNVPAQALILLNDPLVIELADQWGQRACQAAFATATDASAAIPQGIHWLYQSGFGRPPTDLETQTASRFLTEEAVRQQLSVDDQKVWGALAHVLVNTKEFIFLR